MTAVILWKEYREQRAVWLVFILVALGFVYGIVPMMDEAPGRVILGLAAVVLAWTFGVVSGSMLLAGEREDGTLRFLDTLPGDRSRLWAAKVVAGSLFTFAQAAALIGVVAWSDKTYPDTPGVALAMIPASAAFGLMWGLAGGAMAETVLGSIGRALAGQFVILPAVSFLLAMPAVVISLIFTAKPDGGGWGVGILLALGLSLAPLPLSALTFTEIDRQRRAGSRPVEWPSPWSAAFRLSWQQTWRVLLTATLAAMPAGFWVLVGGPEDWPVAWPVTTLVAGVVIGATLFAGEQAGPRRFLAEQRFPLGPIWWTRVGLGLAGLAAAWLVLLTPTLAAAWTRNEVESIAAVRRFGTTFLGETIPISAYLLVWPMTGFAAGVVCGLLLRKSLVAVVAALPLAVLMAAVWVPSMITGGLSTWQTLAAPLVLLALTRWLMHPWAADEGVGKRVAIGGLVALAMTLAGVMTRFMAVPNVPEPAGLPVFLTALREAKEHGGGESTRRACEQLLHQSKEFFDAMPPGGMEPYYYLLHEATAKGWPRDVGLDRWMDEQMAGDWVGHLDDAAKRPTGVVLDPRQLTFKTPAPVLNGADLASRLLAGDGVRQKDPGVFVVNLDRALTVAGNVGRFGPLGAIATAVRIESRHWTALDTWLRRPTLDVATLRRVEAVLARYNVPTDDEAERLADYVLARNLLDRPQNFRLTEPESFNRITTAEFGLFEGMVRVPWEKVRQERLLRAAYFAPGRLTGFEGRDVRAVIPTPWGDRGWTKRRWLDFEATKLKVALRRYEVENGKPAERLEDLGVPIPADPFGAGPLRYRVEDGQGVIWSVGEDRIDDGGFHACPPEQKRSQPGEDIVYRVPRPG